MLNFDEINELYAAMSPRARERLLSLAKKYVQEWPAPKKSGLLRLVKSDLNSKLLTNVVHSQINLATPLSVRKAVDK